MELDKFVKQIQLLYLIRGYLIRNDERCILIVFCDSSNYYYRLTKNINGFLFELAYKE